MAQSQGVVVNEGSLEIDNHGNFNPKGHKLRNTLIVVGIAAATIATMGAAGVFAAGGGIGGGVAGGTGAGVAAGAGGGVGAGLGATGGVLAGLPGSALGVGAGSAMAGAAMPAGAALAGLAGSGAGVAGAAPSMGAVTLNAAGVPTMAASTGVSAAMPAAASTGALGTAGTVGSVGAGLSQLGSNAADMADNSGQDVGRGDFGNDPAGNEEGFSNESPNGNEEGFSQSGSKLNDVAKWANRLKGVTDQFRSGGSNDSGPNPEDVRAANEANMMSLNRRGDTEINQRGPSSDQIALGNIMRAGNRANWKDVAPGADGQPGISIDPQTRALYQSYSDEMKRRMGAGEPLTMSGVPKATAEELALAAQARRGAKLNPAQKVQRGMDQFGNYVDTAGKVIDVGSKIASFF
jgi:hypothetical protein